jgi:hypothetical protein
VQHVDCPPDVDNKAVGIELAPGPNTAPVKL